MSEDNYRLSVYLSKILRHKPEEIGLDMDSHGWVNVGQLIKNINKTGKYTLKLTMPMLESIVANDSKGRYRFNENKTKIKACQGHSVSWVTPELTYKTPPFYLYHGTNTKALSMIVSSGHISKMKRHGVHLQAEESKAWQSAERWHGLTPVVVKIDVLRMLNDGFKFGESDNGVWIVDDVPRKYICDLIFQKY